MRRSATRGILALLSAPSWLAISLVGVAACGSDGGGGGNSVELQVLNGAACCTPALLVVRVTTPRTTKAVPLGYEDQVQYDNWAKVTVNLNEGELVQFDVINADQDVIMTGQCTVTSDAIDLEYARAYAYYTGFAGAPIVDCADNFVFDGP